MIDAQTCQFCAQWLGALVGGEPAELTPEGLHFRHSIKPQQSSQRGRVVFLQMLRTLNAQQRHEQQREQACAQAIEGRADFTIELAADPQQPAFHQSWEGKQHTHPGDARAVTEQRCGIIEHPQMGELPIDAAIARVAIQTQR